MATSSQEHGHEPNLTIPVTRFSNPSTLSKSVQQNPYMVRVGVMIDEATEPGTTDEDAARHRQRITALLTGNNPPNMPAKSRPITAGDAVAIALRQRLKSEDETAVKNTLILLDEIMRTVPYFYRHIANEKFFRRMWRFVVPDYKNNWMTIFRQKPSLVGMEGFESEITKRVLILIRAWAEELSVMFHGRFDPDAGFFIERYRNKRSRVPFPEVPKTSTPWVCRVPSSVGASRYPTLYSRSAAGAGSSSAQVQRMMSLDEVENTVKLFGSIIDGATSSEDVKEDVCADLASRCMQINENLDRFSANWDKEEELARTVQTSELLQRSLNRYNTLLNGTTANNGPSRASDSIDALPPRSVGLDSDDNDSYRDAFSDDDSMSHNVRKLSVRSDTSTAVTTTRRGFDGGRRSSGTDRYNQPRSTLDNDATSRDVGRMRSVDERRLQSRDFERDRERDRFRSRHHDDHPPRSRDDLEVRREIHRDDDHDLRNRPRSRARDDEAIERRERVAEQRSSSRDKRYGSQVERGEDGERKGRKSKGSASAGTSRREHNDDEVIDKRERKSSASKKASSSSSKRSKADGNTENGTGESTSKGSAGPVINKKKNISSAHGSEKKLIKYDEDEEFDDDEKEDDQHQESFQMLAERFPAPKHRKGSKRSSKKKVTGYGGGQQSVRGQDMVPGGMGQPMGMYPGGAGMGVNPMMMPQAMPQPNPYAMYQTVNPVGMPDGGMGMYGAYSTVNPGMYYASVNPAMMNTLNRMGSAGLMHDGSAGPPAGALGMNPMPMGMNVMNSVPAMHMGAGPADTAAMGQPAMTRSVSGIPPPPQGTDQQHQQQQEQTGTGYQDDGKASGTGSGSNQVAMPLAPGDSDYNVAMGGMPTGPMGMGGMGMGGMGIGGMGMGGMGMDPQNPAAMYQSAMHQAATAYHMAANAYRTMQGQAVIGPPTSSVTTSSEVGGGGVEGGGHANNNIGTSQAQGES